MQEQIGVNPYAAPSARIEQNDVKAFADYVLASRGTRLGAKFIDGLLLVACYVPIIVGAVMQNGSDVNGVGVVLALLGIVGIIALLVIQCMQLYSNGQTLGKKWLNIKIIRTDGSRMGFGRFLGLRWFVPAVLLGMVVPFFAIIDACFIFAEDHKTLHDKIADTVVVNA
jgi:uncharacterized RDD family membrane protein YckC